VPDPVLDWRDHLFLHLELDFPINTQLVLKDLRLDLRFPIHQAKEHDLCLLGHATDPKREYLLPQLPNNHAGLGNHSDPIHRNKSALPLVDSRQT
jgi:hypothetical protein